MVSPVSPATHAQASDQAPAPRPAAAQTKPQSVPADKVTLSPAAQALQEVAETPAQTAAEARRGDMQAKRLQARETAHHVNGR